MTHIPSGRSLRRLYREWVEEQIEEYKDSIPRSELLRLADDVVAKLDTNRRGQYQLTEVLLCEEVDRTIFRLLKLPGYRGWVGTHAAKTALDPAPSPPPDPAAEAPTPRAVRDVREARAVSF